MRRMYRWLTMVGIAGAAALGATTASAAHDHYLLTPGTCVQDIAQGQTSQTTGGGAHQFHDNVHKGTPGTEAFPHTPVSVNKGTCPAP